MKAFLQWHQEKHGSAPVDLSLAGEFLADEGRERSEWIRANLTKATIEALVVTSPSLRLIEAVKSEKLSLHDIGWRQFEDIVAQLLVNDGYRVRAGKRTKDGGVDIFAEKQVDQLGMILSVWQAKRLKPKNKVGISTIRELADTRLEHGASKGVIVTNSFLTRGAITRIERDKYTLGKLDGHDLFRWILKATTS